MSANKFKEIVKSFSKEDIVVCIVVKNNGEISTVSSQKGNLVLASPAFKTGLVRALDSFKNGARTRICSPSEFARLNRDHRRAHFSLVLRALCLVF